MCLTKPFGYPSSKGWQCPKVSLGRVLNAHLPYVDLEPVDWINHKVCDTWPVCRQTASEHLCPLTITRQMLDDRATQIGRLTAQIGWFGLRVGGHPALSLHSSNKPGELSQ